MSNTFLNAVLAIIRNAPEKARNYLREAKVSSVSDVYLAIVREVEKASDTAKVEALRGILHSALRLDGDDPKYIEGIAAVEEIIEEEISKITQRAGTKDQAD